MSKKKICVVTGTRADYGLLSGLLREIRADQDFKLQLVVTGTHLEKRFGYTYNQILKDGFIADVKIIMRLNSDTDKDIVSGVGRELIGLARAFDKLKPDMVVVLGDRFEMLAVASAALLFRIPIAHIHGGEVTEGAYDDAIRHAITKMASLHFATHKDYARRIIQMGEDPRRVFAVGSPSLENINRLASLSKQDLEKMVGFYIDKNTALTTFHPVTNEKGAAERHMRNLLWALDRSGLKVIFTLPNADTEHGVIMEAIENYCKKHAGDARAFASLGQFKYFSLMRHVGLMVGNSSSGILEAPSFKLPVVNIGTRQEGRVKAKNIIDCNEDKQAIYSAIERARLPVFRNSLKTLKNPFDGGLVSAKIAKEIKKFFAYPVSIKKFIDR